MSPKGTQLLVNRNKVSPSGIRDLPIRFPKSSVSPIPVRIKRPNAIRELKG